MFYSFTYVSIWKHFFANSGCFIKQSLTILVHRWKFQQCSTPIPRQGVGNLVGQIGKFPIYLGENAKNAIFEKFLGGLSLLVIPPLLPRYGRRVETVFSRIIRKFNARLELESYLGSRGGMTKAQCVDPVLEGVGKSKKPNFMGITHIFGSVGMS